MRCGVLFALLFVAGCASAPIPVQTSAGAQDVAGLWHGWLITPRDYVAATLTIQSNGVFELIAPRTRVVGKITSAGGVLRFDAASGRASAAGWHGTITVSERGDTRLLKTARDDRLFPGRFTPDPGA